MNKVRYVYGLTSALLVGGASISLITGSPLGAQVAQNDGAVMDRVVPVAGAPASFADLTAQLQPAVVNIATRQRVEVANNPFAGTPFAELFNRRGLEYVHVPYKGTAEQMIAVSSGQVMAGVNSNGFAPFVDNGKLRLLVTFGEQRTRRWPSVPTLRELGHGIAASSPYGLAGPRGLPPAVVATLHDAFKLAMNDPLHIGELAKYDQELNYLGPEDYGRAMREAFAAERRTVDRLGLARGG